MTKNPIVLYRENVPGSEEDASEKEAIESAGFNIIDSRMLIRPDDLVIGRYSVLPYYKELHNDVIGIRASLINTYGQHLYVANLANWTTDLGGLTPETWHKLSDIPDLGPFVLKGETNSRKHKWNTHMFAVDKKAAIEVYGRLLDDSLIGQQQIYIRRYVPLKRLMTGFHDLPISMEFRFFVAYGVVISSGFYWSSHVGDLASVPSPEIVPMGFLRQVIDIIGNKCNFYALDVALTEAGDWIVIELNDGQMSGLSCNDSGSLYKNLFEVVSKHL